jgi:hypothetical protein
VGGVPRGCAIQLVTHAILRSTRTSRAGAMRNVDASIVQNPCFHRREVGGGQSVTRPLAARAQRLILPQLAQFAYNSPALTVGYL